MEGEQKLRSLVREMIRETFNEASNDVDITRFKAGEDLYNTKGKKIRNGVQLSAGYAYREGRDTYIVKVNPLTDEETKIKLSDVDAQALKKIF